MADWDKFERGLHPLFRLPAKLARTGATAEEVSRSIVKAVAKMLKQDGGCPAFDEIIEVIAPYCQDGPQRKLCLGMTVSDADQQLDAIEREHEHPLTHIAVCAAKGICLQGALDAPISGATDIVFNERFVQEVINDQLLGRIGESMIPKRFNTPTALGLFEDKVRELMSDGVQRVAVDLATDPTATKLRAPRFLRSKRSTSDWKNFEVPTIQA